jgi:hypothetical protein
MNPRGASSAAVHDIRRTGSRVRVQHGHHAHVRASASARIAVGHWIGFGHSTDRSIDRSSPTFRSKSNKRSNLLHKRIHVPNHSTHQSSALPLHAVPAASASSSLNSKRGPFLKLQGSGSTALPLDAVGFLRQSPGLIPRMFTIGARCRCSWCHGLHGSPLLRCDSYLCLLYALRCDRAVSR